MTAPLVTIVRMTDLPDRDRARAAIEAIFFEASSVRAFESAAARAAFLERWLTRYLVQFPREAFVARDAHGAVVGYLAGCLEDPSRNALFSDVTYFRAFAPLLREFPAHLHVNVAAGSRGLGIGAKLIEAFAAHVAASGAPGLHAVTGDGSRNNSFYLGCGFHRAGSAEWNGKRLVLFGRRLG